MKGRNSLVMNEATMREAVQLWVDDHMYSGKRPNVISVKHHQTGSISDFEVKLEEVIETDSD